jgi:hypothetical protein
VSHLGFICVFLVALNVTPLRVSQQLSAVAVKLSDQLTSSALDSLSSHPSAEIMDSRCISCLLQLRQAVVDGDTDVVKQLIAEASAAGTLEQLLTAQDGFPGPCWDTGSSVLQIAAEQGRTDIVCLLLSAGAPVDAVGQLCRTPLHYAACSGHVDIVQLLLSAGANLEQRNKYGRTAFAEAAEYAPVHVLQA